MAQVLLPFTPRTRDTVFEPLTTVRRTLVGSLMFLATVPVAAQVSLVPARHPVYEWLRYQETLGNLRGFPSDALPLTRRALVRHLDQVGALGPELSRFDSVLLDGYRRELSVEGIEQSAAENYIVGARPIAERIWRLHRGDAEPRLYADVGEGYAFAADVIRTVRGTRRVWTGPARTSARADYSESRLRVIVAVDDRFGAHVETGNIGADNNELLRLDPLYGRTADVLVYDKDNAIFVEAMATLRLGPVSADIGHGSLRYGPGSGPSLLLGVESSTHDWARLRIERPRVRYTALLGSLVSASNISGFDTLVAGGDTLLTRQAPERWLALHHLTVVPVPDVDLSITHATLYSRSGVDYGLLTPFAPALVDDVAGQNAVWMLTAAVRPMRGIQLYGALALHNRNRSGGGGARGFDVGAHFAAAGGWELELRKVRLDPFLFSHADSLNAFHQRGFPMGHPLGPNAEQSSLRVRRWLPLRSRLTFAYAAVRKGLNPVGPGGEVVDVGGSLYSTGPPGTVRFLENADVQSYRRVELEGVLEPLRGVEVGLRFERRLMRGGVRLEDMDLLDAWLRVQSPIFDLFRTVATLIP